VAFVGAAAVFGVAVLVVEDEAASELLVSAQEISLITIKFFTLRRVREPETFCPRRASQLSPTSLIDAGKSAV
jgi:hypothetical protein